MKEFDHVLIASKDLKGIIVDITNINDGIDITVETDERNEDGTYSLIRCAPDDLLVLPE